MAPALLHPHDWALGLPLHQQCTGHCWHTVHELPTHPCWAEVYAELGKDPCWAASETKISVHTQDRHSLPSPHLNLLPGTLLVCPHHSQWIFVKQARGLFEVFTGLKREGENDTNAGAIYSTLSQPPMWLHHWWSIRDRHSQIKDEVMETFFWNTVMESHCKNNQELEIYRACSKYDTSQIKLIHTTKPSLNPLSLLIPHALYSVCSLSDLFSSVISKEQMGVLYIHSPLSSIKTSSEYFWPPVHSSSLMFQYPPFTSANFFLHAHILAFLPIHYFLKETFFPNPETSPQSINWLTLLACQ